MKKTFSKRWLSNLLIVLFGAVILFIASLLMYRAFFISADVTDVNIGDGHDPQLNFVYSPETISPPTRGYRLATISGSDLRFLEVFDQTQITSAMGTQTSSHPTYVVPYSFVVSADEPNQYSTMAIVPLPPYNYDYRKLASSSSASYKLLNWAKDKAVQTNNPSDRDTLNAAVEQYNRAILLATSTYLVDDATKTVLTKDPNVLSQCQGSPANCDPNVAAGVIDDNTGADPYALKVSIDPGTHYVQPHSDSLAMNILNSTSAEAGRVSDTTGKAKIDAAIVNYRRQIQTPSSSDGLSISSVNTLQHEESQTVNYSVNFAQLNIGNGVALSRVIFNIDEKTLCNVEFRGDSSNLTSDSQNCTWNSGTNAGTFAWTATTTQDVGTAIPGTRTLMLKAFSTASADNDFGRVSKSVTVLPGTGEDTTPGGGVIPMSITVPQSVDKSNTSIVNAVPIKISASNLRGNPPVGKIAWYVCVGTQQTIQNNDSTGCEEKEKFGPFEQASFTDKIVNWNASGSAPGTYVIMTKAFGMSTAPDTYPPYPGATKVVSSNITVVENMIGGGGGDGGTGDGITGDIKPDWAANLQKSSIETITALINRSGGFMLLILGILVIIAIIIAGMKYITSAGDPKGAETGKKGVLFAIYGVIGAVLCVMLIKTTISEVQGIIGERLPNPSTPGSIILPGLGGPNASVLDIIGHSSGLIWRVIQLAVYYAEAVAVFYIMYASFIYVTSFGDDSKAENGKKTLIWAVIGLAFILSANILISVFGKAFL